MALAASGLISLGGSTAGRSVNLELKKSATAVCSLNDTAVRALAKKSSGVISLHDLHGKSSSVPVTPTVVDTGGCGDAVYAYSLQAGQGSINPSNFRLNGMQIMSMAGGPDYTGWFTLLMLGIHARSKVYSVSCNGLTLLGSNLTSFTHNEELPYYPAYTTWSWSGGYGINSSNLGWAQPGLQRTIYMS